MVRSISALALAGAVAMAACTVTTMPPGTGGTGGTGTTGGGGAGTGGEASTGGATSTSSGGGGPFVGACNAGGPLTCNPYGVDLEAPALTGEAYWSFLKNTLVVPYYKPAPIYLGADAACPRCTEAIQHGLRLVLRVHAGDGPGKPASLPQDMSMYRARLGELLDSYAAAVGAVVIEDGAETPETWAGSIEDYQALLHEACDVAHEKAVNCTDGGITSTTMMLLIADYEIGNANAGSAIKMLTLAGDNPELVAAFPTWPPATEEDVKAALAGQKARLDAAKTLLAGARAVGLDYPSFRWYERDQDTLDHAMALTRLLSGCNAIATTDLGQRTQDMFEAMHKADDAKELGMSLVIWTSHAGVDAPLVDDEGNVTPNGKALQTLSTTTFCGD
ncbi:Hypothetical protein A7982_03835 [Minicystis rosea]|nr:Hypothetical protein A7982_03835 [Minicystis rosea]